MSSDSADHAAALFDLVGGGISLQRIANPRRPFWSAASPHSKEGVGALAVATGQAALYYAFANVADAGGDIVAAPYSLWDNPYAASTCSGAYKAWKCDLPRADSPQDMAAAIDADNQGRFVESFGIPAGRLCDIAALADVAHDAMAFPLIVDNTVPTHILLRPIEHGAILSSTP